MKLLVENLEPDEKVLAKIKGNFGQGFVVTDKHVFILKWGFMAGSMFGGRCIGYAYPNITALEMKKQATYCLVEIFTPANQSNRKLSYWGNDGNNDAIKSENAVTFSRAQPEIKAFQEAIMLARGTMIKTNGSVQSTSISDGVDQLEKLAELRDKGIITEEEFTTKKKRILNI